MYPFPIQHTAVQGLNIATTDIGKGPTILFIHGLAGYMPLWQFQISGLEKQNRCIAIDLPGNGLSDPGPNPYSMVFYADIIAEFIQNQQLSNLTLAGHSMGGQIAVMVALRYPHLIDKLILIAPAGFENFTASEKQMLTHALEIGQIWGIQNNYLDQFIHWSFYQPNPLADKISKELISLASGADIKEWHRMITESIVSMLNEPIIPHLEQISQPTLIIFGENDALIPNKLIHFQDTTKGIAYKGAALIPKSDLHIIPQSGHFVQLEKPGEVTAIVSEFIRK